ncbi:autotransporter outer membrane beta-barrel domain-containing protein [Rickettsia tillamookensis]|nr:autotransporter outer membrane beta-barrel domain-containing protein [Rickettsia tillamookensis]
MSKNFLKKFEISLATVSTLALMLHGNSTLGAADAIVTNNADLTTGVGLNPAAIFGGGTLQYNSKGAWTVDANIAGGVIQAIDTDKGSNNQTPGILTVNENTSIGSINKTGLYDNRLSIEIAGNKTLTLTGTAGTGIAADTYENLASINFGAGAVLTGNAASGKSITFKSSIINGVNGTLNAQTPMIFLHASVGTLNTINIGAGSSVTIDTLAGNVNLNGDAIRFADAASVLQLDSFANRTITLTTNLSGKAGNGGIVKLIGGAAGNSLTLRSKTGAETLGTGVNKLAQLAVGNKVVISGTVGTNLLDVSNALVLNIYKGATFIDESTSSARIPKINIGADAGKGVGRAVYTVDVSRAAGDVDFLVAGAGNVLTFLHETSELTVQNTAAVDQTVIFNNNVAGVNNGGGIVNFSSTGGNLLTIKGVDVGAGAPQLGNGSNIASLNITGKVTIAGGGDLLDVSRSEVLNVNSGAIFTDEGSTSARISQINIGTRGGRGAGAQYIVDVSQAVGDVDFLTAGAGNVLTVLDTNSRLIVTNKAAIDKTVIFNNNIVVANGGGCVVGFVNNNSASNLILKGVNNPQFGNFFNIELLGVTGNVTIRGAANLIDVSRSNKLDVNNGAIFTDESATSINIAEINIGADEGTGAGVGPATYAIDVSQGGNIDVLTVADSIRFFDPNSIFQIQNTIANADTTVTFKNILKGGVTPAGGGAVVGDGGIVKLISSNANSLTVQGDTGGETLGTNANKLAMLAAGGAVTISGEAGHKLDVQNTMIFDIYAGATLTDRSRSSAQIPTVNIGANGGAGVGTATYILDAQTGDFAVLTVGKTISFLHEDSVLQLQNSSVADDRTITLAGVLDPLAPNTGKVTINSVIAGKKLTINGTAAGAILGTRNHKLKELTIIGAGKLDIKSTIFANNLFFRANTQLTQDGDIEGDVDFKNQDASITIADGKKITGSITSTDNGAVVTNGTITFDGDGSIGGNVKGLKLLQVGTGNVSLLTGGDTVIGEIRGNGIGILTLPQNFKLTGSINNGVGQAVQLNFTGGTNSVSGVVGTAASPVGNITTNGATSFASSINSNGIVTLSPGSVNIFADNITANNVVVSGATLTFTNNLTVNSNLTGRDTTINLNAATVSYTGQSSFSGKLIVTTRYDQTKNSGGNIVITPGSKMDLSSLDELEIQFNGADVRIGEINENTKYSLISSEDGNGLIPLPADKIKFFINGNDNSFIKWSINTSSLTLSATNISNEILQEEINEGSFTPEESQDISTLIRAPEDTDADIFKDEFGFFTIEQQKEALDRVTPDMVRPGAVITAVNTQAVSHNIVSNLTSLGSRINTVQTSQNKVAISAGDEAEVDFGAWASPFVGNSTQKARNNLSGYKSNSTGGTVGFDSLVGNDFLLGVAYTRADTKVKQKNNNVGDKSKILSNIYSLYGLYNIPNKNWFFEIIASYGDSKVKNYSQRNIASGRNLINYEMAIGKYKSRSYTGQILAGYSYLAPKAINLTPTVGVRYSDIRDSGYTETGTTFQNLIVKGKKYNTIEGLAGVRMSKDINVENIVLIPAIYGMLDYNFKDKTPAIDARLQGMDSPFTTNSFKPAKTSFNFGVGVTAKYRMMEYGVNYDANAASKYFAQQGSLKIRVNF